MTVAGPAADIPRGLPLAVRAPALLLPSLRLLIGGALLWSLTMLASLAVYQWRVYGFNNPHLLALAGIYFAGGYLGWTAAVPVAWFITRNRARDTRLAAYFLGLPLATIGFTAFAFALQYRIFYAQWHAPFGSKIWLIQFAETGISSSYQFLVLGMPQYLPIAFPALLFVSFALAKGMR